LAPWPGRMCPFIGRAIKPGIDGSCVAEVQGVELRHHGLRPLKTSLSWCFYWAENNIVKSALHMLDKEYLASYLRESYRYRDISFVLKN